MDAEIARWRLHSQGLSGPRADSAAQAVGRLLCVQAENPSQSAWAVASRTAVPDADDLATLLTSGAVVRTHVLRPTWHYVLREDADWLLALTGPRVRGLVERQLVSDVGLRTGELEALGGAVLEALAATPDLTRPEVAEAVRERLPALGSRLTGQVLMLLMAYLELDRLVCSGRPVDGEHTYATWADRVVDRTELADGDREEHLGRLALRYLTGHGPATVKDLAYWATLTLGDARLGVEAARHRLESFEHDGRLYWHAAGTPRPVGTVDPAGHLLQVLDEIYRGYQDSRWMIDAEGIVPRTREAAIGMALVDGQLVAGMRRTLHRTRVQLDIRPYRRLTSGERAAIDAAAERYGHYLGLEPDVVVPPSP
ncbi:winged helix DNA-binding domain-containing protein [Actinotalea sp. K2]|uniref:winged helix DNA-binding domain-containing protein n=1 Tax=Actinotalea sp. K2 TaxID=2939438 RepID=UPI002016F3E7|nr:winged helix DNA-binding domain-containing protein [Actinotalea sp. K2]MCL3861200.1 winged helix DNA-binding domain-containing protein [Actinotalea sp. K2]